MNRMFHVAKREFTSTVMTKGFIIGVAILPLIMLVAIVLVPMFTTSKPPSVSGTVAIVDRSGAVADGFIKRLSPDVLASRYAADLRAAEEAAAQMTPPGTAPAVAGAAAQAMVGAFPDLKVEVLSRDADVEALKAPMREGTALDGGRLALVVVDETAVKAPEPAGGGMPTWGSYTVYVKPKLDVRVDRDVIRSAVIEEIKEQRIKAAGHDPARLHALMDVPSKASETVLRDGGSRSSSGRMQFLLPFAFMMLLWIAVMTGGQYLLTTTIEEKSNRIMEVLLSAVTPMQLMLGKILGQMAVGLLILLVYTALGAGALSSFKMLDLLDWTNVGLLVIYFMIAYFLIASVMAAVGSAVSEIHEAQSLITPIMMLLIVPLVFSPAIINNPNGTLATVLSFIPPVSPIVMVIRLPAAEAIPAWQIAASIGIGLLSVVAAAWMAAKVFRIGSLMYGKPPNFTTLIKWIKMA